MRLTGPGTAAIAVVRIAGPNVREFLKSHFSKKIAPEKCVHGELRDETGRVIDDPIVVSACGFAFADLNLHGGEWVINSCLKLVRRAGFEVVESFAEISESESEIAREVLADLPSARTELAIRMLLDQPRAWANLDCETIDAAMDDRTLHWLMNPPRVAIVGVPNAGKSTLANRLFGANRSITADLPGTTRDWVGDFANIDGLPIMLIDTPGLRESNDVIEQTAITVARTQIASTDLVIVVTDPTQPCEAQIQIRDAHPNALVVLNKIDQSPIWDAKSMGAIQTVATEDRGIDELRRGIRAHFIISEIPAARWWKTAQRQRLAEIRKSIA